MLVAVMFEMAVVAIDDSSVGGSADCDGSGGGGSGDGGSYSGGGIGGGRSPRANTASTSTHEVINVPSLECQIKRNRCANMKGRPLLERYTATWMTSSRIKCT